MNCFEASALAFDVGFARLGDEFFPNHLVVRIAERGARAFGRRDGHDPNRAHASPALEPIPFDDGPRLAGVWRLVVNDEADTRGLLVHVLGEFGAEVRATDSVREALALLDGGSAWRPGALVSDVGMPGAYGYALIRAVRSHASPTRNEPVARWAGL